MYRRVYQWTTLVFSLHAGGCLLELQASLRKFCSRSQISIIIYTSRLVPGCQVRSDIVFLCLVQISMLIWSYVIFFCQNLFKCLFDCCCFNPIREYFPHVETSTLSGLTLHLRPLSRKVSLSCHTCCVSSNRPPKCIDMNVSIFLLLDLSKRVYESR